MKGLSSGNNPYDDKAESDMHKIKKHQKYDVYDEFFNKSDNDSISAEKVFFCPSFDKGIGEKERIIVEDIFEKERADISWIMSGFGSMIQRIFKMVKDELGIKGEETINKCLFQLGKEMGENIKKEYDLGNTAKDMAFLMLAHELRWGLKADIKSLGEKRSVLRIDYCPFASRFGGSFSSPEDCLLWRHYALGLAKGLGENIEFGEARKKLTKGDEYCEYVFEIKNRT